MQRETWIDIFVGVDPHHHDCPDSTLNTGDPAMPDLIGVLTLSLFVLVSGGESLYLAAGNLIQASAESAEYIRVFEVSGQPSEAVQGIALHRIALAETALHNVLRRVPSTPSPQFENETNINIIIPHSARLTPRKPPQ